MKWSRKILVAICVVSMMAVAVILFIAAFPRNNIQALSESLLCSRADITYSDDVRIVMDKSTYQPDDVISFYLMNGSEELYTCGREFAIKMSDKEGWRVMFPDSLIQMFEAELFILKPYSKSESHSIDLKKYSRLQNGTYRIYKEVTDENDDSYMIYTEFQIEQQ